VAGGQVVYVPDDSPPATEVGFFGWEARDYYPHELEPAPAPPPSVVSIERAPFDAILAVHGVDDDGRIASSKQRQFEADRGLGAALSALPVAGPMESTFLQREAALALAWAQFRIDGGDPEIGAMLLRQVGLVPPVTRLWAPACSGADETDRQERDQKESEARSLAAHAQIAALQAGPNRKPCDEGGVCAYLVAPGHPTPERLKHRSPVFLRQLDEEPADYVLADGSRLYIEPAVFGLRPAEDPPHRLFQGSDVLPVPYAIGSRPPPPLTDDAYLRLVKRLPIDTSERPGPWVPMNSATKRMLDDRLANKLRRALGTKLMEHERAVVVRGCLVRPDVAARREFEAIRGEALVRARAVNETQHPRYREHEDAIARKVDRELAGRYESLLADYIRAAGPGYVPWGSLIVSATDEIADVAKDLLDRVRKLLSARGDEPVSSEELAAALGVPVDSKDLYRAAENAGWRKIKARKDGARERVWVPNV
jgi:hypothetical protein